MAERGAAPIPDGFVPITHSAPFGAMVGPIYERLDQHGFARAFRVEERHTNGRGVLHGGMLMTFADIVLAQAGIVAVGGPAATIRIVTEFVAPGWIGDWVEGRAEVSRRTRLLVFTRGTLVVGERLLMTASGVYRVARARSADDPTP